ncbi:MAG: IS1595 family transposase [Dehalococcoidia bacterium]
MRSYFSTHLLWMAQRLSREIATIEDAHHGRSVFDTYHRGLVLSSIQSSVGFVEAMINELFQDAADGHGDPNSNYLIPLPETVREGMRIYWRSTKGGWSETLGKYEQLLELASAGSLDHGSQPYQDARMLIRLRNTVVHYRPETSYSDDVGKLERRLQGKFTGNRLMQGSGNPWWPDHCLGAGCAEWAHTAAKRFVDHVVDRLGIDPNYRRHERQGFFLSSRRNGSGSRRELHREAADRTEPEGVSRAGTTMIENPRRATIERGVRKHVETGANLYTDGLSSYRFVGDEYMHEVVEHDASEYVRGEVHANGIENFWALVKRALHGTYVSVEPFHLFRYLDEEVFRFNSRDLTDGARFKVAARAVIGKRLTWADLTTSEAASTA